MKNQALKKVTSNFDTELLYQESRLSVPDIDFILYDKFIFSKQDAVKGKIRKTRATDNLSQKISDKDILDEMKTVLGDYYQDYIDLINTFSDVQRVKDEEVKNVFSLLKVIQVFLIHDPNSAYLTPLWDISFRLENEMSLNMVMTFKKLYEEGNFKTADTQESINIVDSHVERGVKEILDSLLVLDNPILNPSELIIHYATEKIKEYNSSGRKPISLDLESEVIIIVKEVPKDYGFGTVVKEKELSVKLIDLVTGRYRYYTDEVKVGHPGRSAYTIYTKDKSIEGVIDLLSPDKLYKYLKGKADEYVNQAKTEENIKKINTYLITAHCLKFVEQENQIPYFKNLVYRFLEGKLPASQMYFHDIEMIGAFFISENLYNGVAFSVDDENYFFFSQQTISSIQVQVLNYSISENFKEWVLQRIPYYYKRKLMSESVKFRGDFIFDDSENMVVQEAFTFARTSSIADLVDKIYKAQIERIYSDIDALVFTSTESQKIRALYAFAGVATTISILVSLVPGIGGIIGRTTQFLTSAVLLSAESALLFEIAKTTDDYEESNRVNTNAVLNLALGFLFTVPVIAYSQRAKMLSDVSKAVNTLRSTRRTIDEFVRKSMYKVRWKYLNDATRTEVIAELGSRTNVGNKLSVALNSDTVVKKSISNNITKARPHVDFSNLSDDLLMVERYLNDDLLRLTQTRKHIKKVGKNSFAVSQYVVDGDDVLDAATNWILDGQLILESDEIISKTKKTVIEVLQQHKNSNLLDIETYNKINRQLSLSESSFDGHLFRVTQDSQLMGVDVAMSGITKDLTSIPGINVHPGDVLYATISSYSPYVKNNELTSRIAYALTTLRDGSDQFLGLTSKSQQLLNFNRNILKKSKEVFEFITGAAGRIRKAIPEELSNYLDDILENPAYRSMQECIRKPSEKCLEIISPLKRYLEGKGLEDIRIRGLFIWSKMSDQIPNNHYILKANYHGETFLFDLTAAQFKKNPLLLLDGPLILRDQEWKNMYSLTFKSALMKYKDFRTIQSATNNLNGIPSAIMELEGWTVLTPPTWYTNARIKEIREVSTRI